MRKARSSSCFKNRCVHTHYVIRTAQHKQRQKPWFWYYLLIRSSRPQGNREFLWYHLGFLAMPVRILHVFSDSTQVRSLLSSPISISKTGSSLRIFHFGLTLLLVEKKQLVEREDQWWGTGEAAETWRSAHLVNLIKEWPENVKNSLRCQVVMNLLQSHHWTGWR